jgi:glycosyltransferase involved in cell wall biosynthesis
LHGQTRPPDNIVVVADNCTDRTAEIVRQHGRGFQALEAFVAVNTLIYAALSLAKLIPRRRA